MDRNKEATQYVLPQGYVPNIFAKKITKKDLEEREELKLQEIKEGEVVLLREVSEEDMKHYKIEEPKMKGQWVKNTAFVDEKLGDHIKYKMEIHVIDDPENPSVELRLSADEKNKPSMAEVIGHLEITKTDVTVQARQSAEQAQRRANTVEYTLTEKDLEMMGENGKDLEVGQTISMPAEQAEMLKQMNEADPQVGGREVQMKKPKTEA